MDITKTNGNEIKPQLNGFFFQVSFIGRTRHELRSAALNVQTAPNQAMTSIVHLH